MEFLVLLTPTPGKTIDDFRLHTVPGIEAVSRGNRVRALSATLLS